MIDINLKSNKIILFNCLGHRGWYDFGLFEYNAKRQHGIPFEAFIHWFRRHFGHYHQSGDIMSKSPEAR